MPPASSGSAATPQARWPGCSVCDPPASGSQQFHAGHCVGADRPHLFAIWHGRSGAWLARYGPGLRLPSRPTHLGLLSFRAVLDGAQSLVPAEIPAPSSWASPSAIGGLWWQAIATSPAARQLQRRFRSALPWAERVAHHSRKPGLSLLHSGDCPGTG